MFGRNKRRMRSYEPRNAGRWDALSRNTRQSGREYSRPWREPRRRMGWGTRVFIAVVILGLLALAYGSWVTDGFARP